MLNYSLINQIIERNYAQLDEENLENLVSLLEHFDDFESDINLIELRNKAQSYIQEIYIRFMI